MLKKNNLLVIGIPINMSFYYKNKVSFKKLLNYEMICVFQHAMQQLKNEMCLDVSSHHMNVSLHPKNVFCHAKNALKFKRL